MKKPKILLACLYADFGQGGQMKPDFSNASWEFENVYKAWRQLAISRLVDLETHWVDTQSHPAGLRRLIGLAKDVDLIFQVPVTHALGIHLPQAQKIIEGGTPIVSFHPDLHMRYKHPAGDRFVLSRVTEGYDTHTISPAKHMMQQLADDGVRAYHMPFGIPERCDHMPNVAHTYDVSFVGQKHGIREQVISQLRGAGIRVHTWGHFWPDHPDHHGRPSYGDMTTIFNQSKINLNLRWCSRSPEHGQIKGRDFELMGCGAFMMATQHAETDDFHELYLPKTEFAEHHFVHNMIASIKFYLANDEARYAMQRSAYEKREANLWTTRLKQFLEDWGTW
ncbi:MAG: glycosyltransferase [Nitrososphaerales archaeon]